MRATLARDFSVAGALVRGELARHLRERAALRAAPASAQGVTRILLVTDAAHEWRAAHEFAAAGLTVVPAPVGIGVMPAQAAVRYLPSIAALGRSTEALYEILGDLARRVFAATDVRRQALQALQPAARGRGGSHHRVSLPAAPRLRGAAAGAHGGRRQRRGVAAARGVSAAGCRTPTPPTRLTHLLKYEAENRPPPPPPPAPRTWPYAWVGCVAYVAVLMGVTAVLSHGLVRLDAFDVGELDAARVQAGQWWRAWTALTLHVDGPHLAANLLAGVWFGYLAGRQMGVGHRVAHHGHRSCARQPPRGALGSRRASLGRRLDRRVRRSRGHVGLLVAREVGSAPQRGRGAGARSSPAS